MQLRFNDQFLPVHFKEII